MFVSLSGAQILLPETNRNICFSVFLLTHGFFAWGTHIKIKVILLRFSQTCEFWSSKANWRLRFLLPSIIFKNGPLRKQNFTLMGSKVHGLWFVIGGLWSILCVSVFQGCIFACDCNYDWQQQKTQLWRRLLNFRVCMFMKSAVILRQGMFR